jgi:hypothetical protein
MPIKIEKNVPFPKRQNHNGKWKNVVQKMSNGDSFLIPLKYKKKLETTVIIIRQAAKALGYTIVSRRVEDKRVRIWRIK